MPVRLARITYERHIRIWRLRLDPDAAGAGDKFGDLVGFGGDPRRPDEELKVTTHLAGWRVRPVDGGWRDEAGTWVVPVVAVV
ncbi:hypothetical protein [Curtobacterium sp. 1544]|uniref:hypothetical protein n=1 Tax=Curtobacterium sp. 1544 TaxID=3156417 RepID=UPI003398A488